MTGHRLKTQYGPSIKYSSCIRSEFERGKFKLRWVWAWVCGVWGGHRHRRFMVGKCVYGFDTTSTMGEVENSELKG